MTRSVYDTHDNSSNALDTDDPSEESSPVGDANDHKSDEASASSAKSDKPNLGDIVNSTASIDILVETVLPSNRSQRTIVNENSTRSSMDSIKSPGGLKSDHDSASSAVMVPNSTLKVSTEKAKATPSNLLKEENEEIGDSIARNDKSLVDEGKIMSTEKSKTNPLIHGVDQKTSKLRPSANKKDNTSSSPADTAKNQRSATDNADDGSFCALLKDPRVVAGILCCFCIVAILQVLTVVYLVSDSDDDKDENGRSIQSSPSQSPSTIFPTAGPTPLSQFRPIANIAGSVLLETISNCDDCIEDVVTPPIPWSDRQTVTSVEVTSDGGIVVICENEVCGAIHLVDMDLAPHVSGNIYYYWMQTVNQFAAFQGDSLIISFEDVLPYGYWDPNGPVRVNTQVIISNQQVEICNGESNTGGGPFRAGYFNYTGNSESFVPFVGPTFDKDGFSTTFPSNTCQILRDNNQDGTVTSSPSSLYTPRPTHKPTLKPTLPPTFTPSTPASLRPTMTQKPSVGPTPFSCVPTVGPCIDNYVDLQREVASQWYDQPPYGGHTVAICGDMSFAFTVRVLEPNTTVCCASTSCLLSTRSSLPILIISAANATLVGLSFLQTEGDWLISGGNSLVVFEKPGYHTIDRCKFSRGYAREYGGNLFVNGATEIHIFNSTFESGKAEIGGGGAAFQNVRSVHIENSYFLNNLVFDGTGGGGLIFFDFDPSDHSYQRPSVYILGTVFEGNSATIGAGFEIRDLKSPILSLLYSGFVGNFAADFGGAGAIVNSSDVTATISSNYGRDNVASSICPGFYFEDRANIPFEPDCFALAEFVDPVQGCIPSNGNCAQNEDDLMATLRQSLPGDVVAVCGTMSVRSTIMVVQRNITVCCVEGFECSLDSWDGSRSIMVVLGANFTLDGIQMQKGFSNSRGGNLLIDAPGDHAIRNSHLIGGMAGEYGGNLHVANANSVTISSSTFEQGSTDLYGGGGAAFEDTPKVQIEDSSLKSNFVSFEGGAMLFFSSMEQPIPYQEIVISRTVVEYNSALIGGGFLARNMEMLSLTVRDCFFQSNMVEEGSPMGHFQSVSNADLIFRNNMGQDFQGFSELCNSITVAQSKATTRCTVIPRLLNP